MKRCKGPCGERFPEHLLQPRSIPCSDDDGEWCPICAVRSVNQEHDLPPDTAPDDEPALSLWKEARSIMEKRGARRGS